MYFILDMPKKEIRKIVFGLIHEKLLEKHDNPCEANCQEIKKQAVKIYKKLSGFDIYSMYDQHKQQKIREYLYSNINSSMFMYWVNGTPAKREVRLKEYVKHYYSQMSALEIAAICEKLGLIN